MYSFEKTLKTCSKDQDQCSFHGPGSGSHHYGNLNKFDNKTSWLIITNCKCCLIQKLYSLGLLRYFTTTYTSD